MKTANRQGSDRHCAAVVVDRDLGVVTADVDHHRTCIPLISSQHLLRLSDYRRATVDRLNTRLSHRTEDAIVMDVVADHQARLNLEVVGVHSDWRLTEIGVPVDAVSDRRRV